MIGATERASSGHRRCRLPPARFEVASNLSVEEVTILQVRSGNVMSPSLLRAGTYNGNERALFDADNDVSRHVAPVLTP